MLFFEAQAFCEVLHHNNLKISQIGIIFPELVVLLKEAVEDPDFSLILLELVNGRGLGFLNSSGHPKIEN